MTDALDKLFQALSDATRRDILRRLVNETLSVSKISEPYEITMAAVGKHINILADAGLLSTTKEGRIRYAKINIDQLRLAQIWLDAIDDSAAIEFDAIIEALIAED